MISFVIFFPLIAQFPSILAFQNGLKISNSILCGYETDPARFQFGIYPHLLIYPKHCLSCQSEDAHSAAGCRAPLELAGWVQLADRAAHLWHPDAPFLPVTETGSETPALCGFVCFSLDIGEVLLRAV